MHCSAKLSRRLVKPYGMAALQASSSPRLIIMQKKNMINATHGMTAPCASPSPSHPISCKNMMHVMKQPNKGMSRTSRAHPTKCIFKCIFKQPTSHCTTTNPVYPRSSPSRLGAIPGIMLGSSTIVARRPISGVLPQSMLPVLLLNSLLNVIRCVDDRT